MKDVGLSLLIVGTPWRPPASGRSSRRDPRFAGLFLEGAFVVAAWAVVYVVAGGPSTGESLSGNLLAPPAGRGGTVMTAFVPLVLLGWIAVALCCSPTCPGSTRSWPCSYLACCSCRKSTRSRPSRGARAARLPRFQVNEGQCDRLRRPDRLAPLRRRRWRRLRPPLVRPAHAGVVCVPPVFVADQ